MNGDEGYTPWGPVEWHFRVRDGEGKVYLFKMIGYAPSEQEAQQACAMHTSHLLALQGIQLHPIQDIEE